MIATGTKVWITVLADGPDKPPTLVPGIVTNSLVADRMVNRSKAKGGNFWLTQTVEVASYRTPPTQVAYYTVRPERLSNLTERVEHVPAVDGPKGAQPNVIIPALIAQAAKDLARLLPPVSKQQTKDAAKAYAEAPTLAIV